MKLSLSALLLAVCALAARPALAQAQHAPAHAQPVLAHAQPAPAHAQSQQPAAHGAAGPVAHETAPGAAGHAAGHEAGHEAGHDDSVAGHVFHHVEDQVWYPIHIPIGSRTLDLSISKHVVWMWIAAALLIVVFLVATARRALVPKGLYSMLESFVLFIRDEIAIKNIGHHHGPEYVSYLCTAFFFILFMNLVGLLPYGASATGNLNVTVVLALCTFVMTQVAGMRSQGVVGYWAHLVPAGVPKWLYPIMLPVEILGLFTKPFALTVRLFANMVAGHIVILFLLALTVLLSVYVAPISVAFALGIFLLELFVALVQAYVFTMLSALFIGMASSGH